MSEKEKNDEIEFDKVHADFYLYQIIAYCTLINGEPSSNSSTYIRSATMMNEKRNECSFNIHISRSSKCKYAIVNRLEVATGGIFSFQNDNLVRFCLSRLLSNDAALSTSVCSPSDVRSVYSGD